MKNQLIEQLKHIECIIILFVFSMNYLRRFYIIRLLKKNRNTIIILVIENLYFNVLIYVIHKIIF